MSIYITGDLHGDAYRLNKYNLLKNYPNKKNITKDDYVIICGDFGLLWSNIESEEEYLKLEYLNNEPWTTLFIDGNHENFERLNKYPVEEWHGGKVHKITPSVIHLMRGQVFEICGKTVFTFGGARSFDIRDGVLNPDDYGGVLSDRFLDKLYSMRQERKLFRVKGYSWWEQEEPTEEEFKEGKENLSKYDNKVDLILTHEAPSKICQTIYDDKTIYYPLTDYLNDIFLNINFNMWIFGHHHINRLLNPSMACLYDNMIRLPEGEEGHEIFIYSRKTKHNERV